MKASHRQNLMERELISPLLQWRYNGRAPASAPAEKFSL